MPSYTYVAVAPQFGKHSLCCFCQEEKLAMATMDHNGRNGVLTLKKGQYLWVTPSSSQNGWLVGHDDHGNRGQVLEVGTQGAAFSDL